MTKIFNKLKCLFGFHKIIYDMETYELIAFHDYNDKLEKTTYRKYCENCKNMWVFTGKQNGKSIWKKQTI